MIANKNYWYPCVQLHLLGHAYGMVTLRVYFEDGTYFVQTRAFTPIGLYPKGEKSWDSLAAAGHRNSTTNTNGGIELTAEFV